MGLWYEDKIKGCSCSNSKGWCRKIVSEFLGTFVFVFISGCTVANVNFYNESTGDVISYDSASILCINLGIAFGYTLGLYISIENDGYLNFASTILFRLMDKMKNWDVLHLVIAQFFGAFLAALLVWCLYNDQINSFEDRTTGLIFCSVVNGDNYGIASLDLYLKSVLFTIGVMAIIDARKNECAGEPLKTVKPPKNLEPLLIGVVLFVVGMAFSYRAPFYFNPLQDFAGRLVAQIAGCNQMCTFKNPNWWPIIPLFVPVLGSITAAFIYVFFIENNHPKSGSNDTDRDAEEPHGSREITVTIEDGLKREEG